MDETHRTRNSLLTGIPVDNSGTAAPEATNGSKHDLSQVQVRLDHTEDALRSSQASFRKMVEKNPDGMLIIQDEGIVRFMNPAAESMLGITTAAGLGRPCSLPTSRGKPREVELPASDPPGRVAELLTVDISWEGFPATLLTLRDITERKRSRAALESSERKLREVLEHSLAATAVIRNGQLAYVNPAYRKLFDGVDSLFQPDRNPHIHPDDVERVREFASAISPESSEPLDLQFRFFSGSGQDGSSSLRWIHCRGQGIEYQGRPAILLNLLDITKLKELDRLMGVHDRMTSLGRLASGISHDIRNALSSINIYLSALQRLHRQEGSEEKVEAILEQIKAGSHRIESVIKRMRDFSRPSDPELVTGDINALLEESLELCATTLSRNDVTFERNFSLTLPLCTFDPHLMARVLVNLLTNAVEAVGANAASQRKIIVSSALGSDRITIIVGDSGPGIPPGLRSAVFDPFYTTKKDGTGIGLTISHRIVSDHGGLLYVSESSLGGAAFVIELPLTTGARLI